MQMHISNKEEFNKCIIVDHTLIIKEIDRSIKFYNLEFILSFLPPGSILVGGYIRDIILRRLKNKIEKTFYPNAAINNFFGLTKAFFFFRFVILD